MYTVNVSSVQDFMQCRYRWLCRWVLNRVPRNEAPALSQGKLLHLIFEDVLKGERTMEDAINYRCHELAAAGGDSPAVQKAIEGTKDMAEALVQWKDNYEWEVPVLEVEEPFEIDHPLDDTEHGYRIKGRPDRVGVMGGRVWHIQNRGLSAATNFGVYMELATRHYHEHVYAAALSRKYSQYQYGGTMFNLVRKLKYRTNVGKKNESVKTYAQMFFQHPMAIDLNGALHRDVMETLLRYMKEMRRTEERFRLYDEEPMPNEKMNGGFTGNSIDPYFRVLTGQISLWDDEFFKDREDTYAQSDNSHEETN